MNDYICEITFWSKSLLMEIKLLHPITMDFNVILTLTIIALVIAVAFGLFYHVFSVGKEEKEA